MKFKEFKQEIEKRCKNASACKAEFKRVLDSDNYHEILTVLTENIDWCISHKIFDDDLLSKVGNDVLNKNDIYLNVSTNKGYLLAYGSATVEANCSATVKAWGSATVKAYDSATVEAYDSATVEAWGSATVKAYDSATVEANCSATAKAWGSATVKAYDSSTVEAYGSATVEANCSAYINSFNKIEHKISDKVILRYYYENKIVLAENCNK